MADEASPRLTEVFPEAGALGDRLRAGGLTLAIAESSTGGLLGAALTAFSGSSDYVVGGVIAYSDEVKAAQLGVDPRTLAGRGAVSSEVAAQMAEGVRDRLHADLGLAITGVAGPGSATAAKPAGLLFVAVAGGGATEVTRLEGDRGREGNRVAAVREALRLCGARANQGRQVKARKAAR